MTQIDDVATSLRHLSAHHRDELTLLAAAREQLADDGWISRTGVHVPRLAQRVELMVGSIAVVGCTTGSARHATNAVAAVAGPRDVTGVVLVTTKRAHAAVPGVVKGTPVRTVLLEEART